MKNTAAIEAWVVKTLGSRLVRMAGDEAMAAGLAGANEEIMWRIRHYGHQKAENLGRSLPGFAGRGTPQGATDLYFEGLAALRRLKVNCGDEPSFVATLLCGLRYHPQMEEVVDMIHDYATKVGCTPDWREVTPAEADFASPAYPARVGWMPVWVRATGHSSTRRVWRVYLDQDCRHHVGDMVSWRGEWVEYKPPYEPSSNSGREWLLGGYIIVRGKWCELHPRHLPEFEPKTAPEDAPAAEPLAEWEVELLTPPAVSTEG